MGGRWQDDEAIQVWRLFLEVHTRIVRRMDDELQERHQLPIEWYDVLVHLVEAGGRRTMGNLATALLISPSNCSRLVDRLSAEGLVRREADPDDGRVKHAVLTDEGFAVLKAASPTHLDGVNSYFTRFLGDDSEAVRRLFTEVLTELGFAPNVTDTPGRGGGT